MQTGVGAALGALELLRREVNRVVRAVMGIKGADPVRVVVILRGWRTARSVPTSEGVRAVVPGALC